MKIAYLSAATLPSRSANAVHVMKMCSALAAEGHSVRLYGRSCGVGDVDLFGHYGVQPNFELRLTANGPFVVARQIVGAVKDWATFAPDLFYARYRPLATVASFTGVSLIFEAHELTERWVARCCEHLILRKSKRARLVTISKVLADDYIAAGYSRFPGPFVAHDAADALPRRKKAEENRPLRIGFVGSLYPGKGMETIIALAERLPNIAFHVVGGANEHVRMWKARSGAPNLIMHGYVPHSEVSEYLAGFDIALLPMKKKVSVDFKGSDIGRWTSPLKLFEYMAAGLPIVASDLPTIREVLTDGINGLLVDPDDISGWQQSVELLASDKALRHRLAEQAFEKLMSHYSWRSRARQVIENLT